MELSYLPSYLKKSWIFFPDFFKTHLQNNSEDTGRSGSPWNLSESSRVAGNPITPPLHAVLSVTAFNYEDGIYKIRMRRHFVF